MRKSLLAVVAHPDDESYGIGGTLARYAAEGVDVHVAIATDGAAGSVVAGYEEQRERLAEVRAHELEKAGKVLGVTVHSLGYRDSGYVGDPANQHPDAFIQADECEATGRVVRLIRQIRPQVVTTHDETGGYYHPDHIFCYKITTAAFHVAGDPMKYPELGLEPHQPERLYYHVIPRRLIRLYTTLMRLRGQNPKRLGRNQDIDMTNLGIPSRQIHAWIDYRPYWDVKQRASAAHLSQGGGTGFNRLIPLWFQKRYLAAEAFIRAFPSVPDGYRENDLFGL